MNIAILHGRIAADPELRTTKGGTSVLDLRVATPDREKKGDEWVDAPNFHSVTIWGRDAENVAKYLNKGDGIVVRGKIKYEKYEKDGETKWATKIVADMGGIDFGAKKAGGNSSSGDDSYSKPDPDAPF